ncbi:MAG: hypothetical protein Q8P49_02905 [Candidatus Liptonbacteria bacterium]|nr:hypothetical protein [Candidatus Liptonbacteria bacterium]
MISRESSILARNNRDAIRQAKELIAQDASTEDGGKRDIKELRVVLLGPAGTNKWPHQGITKGAPRWLKGRTSASRKRAFN